MYRFTLADRETEVKVKIAFSKIKEIFYTHRRPIPSLFNKGTSLY